MFSLLQLFIFYNVMFLCFLYFLLFSYFLGCIVFFCKQMTEYEMRISDWSSDVCSSDLKSTPARVERGAVIGCGDGHQRLGARIRGKAPHIGGAMLGRDDVDIHAAQRHRPFRHPRQDDPAQRPPRRGRGERDDAQAASEPGARRIEIGRASWRESASKCGYISVVAVSLQKKKTKNNIRE